ncbi:S8/S53 family peptidase [Aquimarina megaterium]|uniref:S8/S53 family peptidase n=1 Tax=Aquimarina megaterium TaxID=1443666 RepID=UPI0004703815|nr:S8/S53 family peptidase [Aquimarina megaterium]
MKEISYYFWHKKEKQRISGSSLAIFLPTDWEHELVEEYIQVKKQEFPEFDIQKTDNYILTISTKDSLDYLDLKKEITDEKFLGVQIEIKFNIDEDEDEIFFTGTSSFLLKLNKNVQLKDIRENHGCKNIENIKNQLFIFRYDSEAKSVNDFNKLFNLTNKNASPIEYIEPNFKTYQKIDFDPSEPDDDKKEAHTLIEKSSFLNECAHRLINTSVKDITKINTPNITIGILDSIIDINHNAIKNNSITGGITQKNFSSSKTPNQINKKRPHGMQCIGLATAMTTNAILNKDLINLGAGCSIASAVVREHLQCCFNENLYTPEMIIKAIDWLVNSKNSKVIIIPWNKHSFKPAGEKSITDCIKYYINNNNVTFVISVGNNSKSVKFPATIREVISVGAVDLDGKYIAKQSRGWWSNEGDEVDIAAPGKHLITTDFSGEAGKNYRLNGVEYLDYCTFKGTSAATPIVGGGIGLMLSLAERKNIDLKPDKIKDILLSSVLKPAGWETKKWGEGILNISASLAKI